MKVSVKQKHIDAGKKRDCEACPIALALTEQANCPQPPTVIVTYIYNNHPNDIRPIALGYVNIDDLKFTMPLEAIKFAADFDNDKPVSPFEFEIGR